MIHFVGMLFIGALCAGAAVVDTGSKAVSEMQPFNNLFVKIDAGDWIISEEMEDKTDNIDSKILDNQSSESESSESSESSETSESSESGFDRMYDWMDLLH